MQFIKEYVPDKRWQTGQRPIVVKSSFLNFISWKIICFLNFITSSMVRGVEKSFSIVEEKEEISLEETK